MLIFNKIITSTLCVMLFTATVFAQYATTRSGLQYQIVKQGNDKHPHRGCRVWVEYTGSLTDGSIFASTEGSGNIDVWMGQGQLIKAWEEALPMIGEGGQIKLIVPPALGYGDFELPDIPKNSTLHFDLKLIQVDSFPPIEPFSTKGLKMQKLPNGIKYYCVKASNGKLPNRGDNVYIHYTGWLPDGEIYTSTQHSRDPRRFTAGKGEAFEGMDSALLLMPEGSKYRFIIPQQLAFGDAGYANRIPPKTDVTLDIEMVRISREVKVEKWNAAGLDTITTASGLRYIVFEPGYGKLIEHDNIVTAHYSAFYNDSLFDSSVKRESPIRYPVGAGIVIDGWEEASLLMRLGARFQLLVPHNLAFGADGLQIGLPADADVVFDVEILDVVE